MQFEKIVELSDGRKCILRNAKMEDATRLLEYLKVTSEETPYLMREPEEIVLTLEQEKAFIKGKINSPRELLLIAELDGELVGNCSIASMGSYLRYQHRCSVAIALYQKFCGLGIGKIMMQTILEIAVQCNYEQAELEVVTTNKPAVCLYKNLGFETYAIQKHSMKYKDGSYSDVYLMMKCLK